MTTTKNISVTVRVRPEPVDTASKGLTVDEASSNITIRMTNNQAAGSTAAGDTVQYDFPFDQILDEKCNQEKVFRLSGTSIVDDAMNGFNGSVLSYGQTGAGKVSVTTLYLSVECTDIYFMFKYTYLVDIYDVWSTDRLAHLRRGIHRAIGQVFIPKNTSNERCNILSEVINIRDIQ